METVSPSAFVRYLETRFPGCYSLVSSLRSGKEWPSVLDVTNMLMEHYRMDGTAASYYAPALCACAVWNCYKRIYAFQEPLARTLCGDLDAVPALGFPIDPLCNLPLPGIYIQAPDCICSGIHGFFVWISESAVGGKVLQLLFLHSDGFYFTSGSIRLFPGMTLCDCLPDSDELLYPLILAAGRGEEGALRVILRKLPVNLPFQNEIHNLTVRGAQLLLYLVSANADIETPAEENPIQEVFPVGKRISRSISSVSRRSHIRQGHWHKYWYGPKNGQRRLISKWIPPVIVGDDPELAVKLSVQDVK